MKNNNSYTQKGSYRHPQFEGGITLKQYIFTKSDNKKCILFRFRNESSLPIKSFEFVLTELSADGKVICKRKILQNNLKFAPGDTYTPNCGFEVSEGCVDFRIKLISYVSGAYKYLVIGRRAISHYDPRGYNVSPSAFNANYNVTVISKLTEDSKIFKLVAVIAIILIITAYLLL